MSEYEIVEDVEATNDEAAHRGKLLREDIAGRVAVTLSGVTGHRGIFRQHPCSCGFI